MANIPGEIVWQANDNTWFTNNAAEVYPAGITIYHVDGRYKFTDGVTTLGALPFRGDGGTETQNLQDVTDNGANTTNQMQINGVNVATVNDIPSLSGYEQTVNKSTSVNTDQASNTKYPSVKAVYDWVTSLFVKKGTLTTNYIQKATGTDTIANSTITDDGTTVTVNSPTVITSDNSNNQIISIDNLKALVAHDVKILFNSPIYSFANMQANETVETDASKNLVSAAKQSGYNLPLGTTAGTVLEGDKGLLIANNLSDLSNPLTARNNLKEWDLIITTGNQSTTSNVATNITGLVSPTLTANKLYDFEGYIYTSCNNTGGVKFQITLPSGATLAACFDGSIGTNATFQSSLVTASATLTGFSFIQFNGSNIIKVKGHVLLGGTAGTIQFGFASNTNTQTSTINQLGTHITVKQLN